LWLLLFSVLYFAFRIPYLIAPLHYEEGIFAEIFYTQPPNHDYIFLGRISSNNLYMPTAHPAIIYELLTHYGLLWNVIVNYETSNITTLTFFIRLAFSMFQFLVIGVIVWMILQRRDSDSWKNRITIITWITILAVTPPAMIMSTSIQVDGSVGTLLAGLLAVALLGYRLKIYPERAAFIFVFISSLLFGLGKNEWSLALVLTLLLTVGYLYLMNRKNGDNKSIKTSWVLLGFIFTGLLLGNLISYLYDPEAYLGGFDVMFRISKVSSYNFISFGFERLAFTYVNLLVLAFIAIVLIRSWKKADYILFLYFTLGVILFFAYFITSWAVEPRYYAPSLIVGLAGAVVAYEHLSSAKTRLLLWGISFVLLVITFRNVLEDKNRIRLYSQLGLPNYANSQITTIPSGCIPRMGTGEAFGQKFDFISNSLSPEDASRLAAKYGKEICQP
jgi:hypothetical protein